MLIDWFTIIAQIVNFLILVALLKYFLYGRIVAAMDRREQQIASGWAQAEQNQREAQEQSESYRRKHEELEQRREELIGEAKQEVDRRRKQLLERARDEVNELRARWADTVEQETDGFLRELRERAAREISLVARTALADLASADLQQRVVAVFLQRIESLDRQQRDKFVESIGTSDRAGVVRSAFEVPPDARHRIVEALRARLSDELQVRFEVSPDLTCGIEFSAGGHKIAWEIGHYLQALEDRIRELLEREIESRRSQQPSRPDEQHAPGESRTPAEPVQSPKGDDAS